jgi:hypothetical protein
MGDEETGNPTERRRTAQGVDGFGRPTQVQTWQRPASFLYFVLAEEVQRIHIATTSDVRRRIKELQAFSPCPLEVIKAVAGGSAKEAVIHEQFSAERLWAKWFTATEELREFIRELPAEPW